MTAQVYSLARARRRDQAPAFVFPKSLTVFAETFGIGLPRRFSRFRLQRSRKGTHVFIGEGPLEINLSAATKTYPPSFKTARRWIAAVAERHAWTLKEVNQRPRGTALTTEAKP